MTHYVQLSTRQRRRRLYRDRRLWQRRQKRLGDRRRHVRCLRDVRCCDASNRQPDRGLAERPTHGAMRRGQEMWDARSVSRLLPSFFVQQPKGTCPLRTCDVRDSRRQLRGSAPPRNAEAERRPTTKMCDVAWWPGRDVRCADVRR